MVSLFDVYENGRLVIEGSTALAIAEKFNTSYQEVYACARMEKPLEGAYQVYENKVNEENSDLSFIKKFGWKTFKEWTAMNRRYGTNR